jgi:hypothetical protein
MLGAERLWKKIRKIISGNKGEQVARWREIEDFKQRQAKLREVVEREVDDRIKIWIRIKLGGERKVDLGRE